MSPTGPRVAPSAPYLIVWGDNPTLNAFYSYEKLLGRRFDGGRGRGAYGNLDVPVLNKFMLDLAAQGYIVSTNITPKKGQGPGTSPSGKEERLGVPYPDVYVKHLYDAFLTQQATILKSVAQYATAANGYKNIICELHSEAEIQHGLPTDHPPVPDAQPYVGPSTQFKPFFRYVVNFMAAQGVTNVWWAMSLTSPTFNNDLAKLWYPGPLCDLVAVDGYSHPKSVGIARSVSFIAGAALTFAMSKNRKLAVTETGAQETPGDPNAKALWLGDWSTWSRTNEASLWGLVLNHSNDGDGGWWLDTTPQSLAAAQALITSSPYSLTTKP